MTQGGKRSGAGRKPKLKPREIVAPLAAKRNIAQEVIDALNNPEFTHCVSDTPKCLVCLLVDDCRELNGSGAAQRRWITEMAQGKAVHHVNHMHDKPLEMNVTLTMSERMKKAMQEAEERVRRNR